MGVGVVWEGVGRKHGGLVQFYIPSHGALVEFLHFVLTIREEPDKVCRLSSISNFLPQKVSSRKGCTETVDPGMPIYSTLSHNHHQPNQKPSTHRRARSLIHIPSGKPAVAVRAARKVLLQQIPHSPANTQLLGRVRLDVHPLHVAQRLERPALHHDELIRSALLRRGVDVPAGKGKQLDVAVVAELGERVRHQLVHVIQVGGAGGVERRGDSGEVQGRGEVALDGARVRGGGRGRRVLRGVEEAVRVGVGRGGDVERPEPVIARDLLNLLRALEFGKRCLGRMASGGCDTVVSVCFL